MIRVDGIIAQITDCNQLPYKEFHELQINFIFIGPFTSFKSFHYKQTLSCYYQAMHKEPNKARLVELDLATCPYS